MGNSWHWDHLVAYMKGKVQCLVCYKVMTSNAFAFHNHLMSHMRKIGVNDPSSPIRPDHDRLMRLLSLIDEGIPFFYYCDWCQEYVSQQFYTYHLRECWWRHTNQEYFMTNVRFNDHYFCCDCDHVKTDRLWSLDGSFSWDGWWCNEKEKEVAPTDCMCEQFISDKVLADREKAMET